MPIAYYQPETSVAVGAAGGYYFESCDLKKISSLSYSAIYTFKNQFIFSLAPKLYSRDKKTYYYLDLKARYYPDNFYGLAASDISEGEEYVSRTINLLFQPQRFLSKYWSIGANLIARYESPLINSDKPVLGWDPYSITGLGFVTTFDSRDNVFYPELGFFSKLSCWLSDKNLLSTYSTSSINLDVRNYIPLGKKHIFAYQLYGQLQSGDAPFQLLPTLGGSDKMRGFREGMFKDDLFLMMQAEYRFPLYKRLKGAAFAGMAQMYDVSDFTNDKLKISYGAGLRYRLNDARVHLRFDYGFNNYGTSAFYIIATEAF